MFRAKSKHVDRSNKFYFIFKTTKNGFCMLVSSVLQRHDELFSCLKAQCIIYVLFCLKVIVMLICTFQSNFQAAVNHTAGAK